MFLLYTLVGAGWGWLCYQNLQDLLPIQVRPFMLSANILLIVSDSQVLSLELARIPHCGNDRQLG